jgi:hypothetical protein
MRFLFCVMAYRGRTGGYCRRESKRLCCQLCVKQMSAVLKRRAKLPVQRLECVWDRSSLPHHEASLCSFRQSLQQVALIPAKCFALLENFHTLREETGFNC